MIFFQFKYFDFKVLACFIKHLPKGNLYVFKADNIFTAIKSILHGQSFYCLITGLAPMVC